MASDIGELYSGIEQEALTSVGNLEPEAHTGQSTITEEEYESDHSHSTSDDSTDSGDEQDESVVRDMKKLENEFTGISGRFRLINRIGEGLLNHVHSFARALMLTECPCIGTFSTVYRAEDLLYDHYQNNWYKGPPGARDNNDIPRKRRRLDDTCEQGSRIQAVKTKKPRHYVALKKIYVTSSPSRIMNELEIMLDLRGFDSVCHIITAFRCHDQVIAVLPYFPHVDFRILYRTFLVEDMRHYFRSLLSAMDAVHGKGIIHRDIKPTNFLYNPELKRGILVDFGLAEYHNPGYDPCVCERWLSSNPLDSSGLQMPSKTLSSGYPKNDSRPSKRANRAGTRGFRAPEVLFKCTAQTTKIDIWSVGVILLTFLGRRFPFFHSLDDIDAMIEIASIFGVRRMRQAAGLHGQVFETTIPTIGDRGYSLERIVQWSSCVEELTDSEKQGVRLLYHLLDLNPRSRYSAESALLHEFFLEPTGDDLPWGGEANMNEDKAAESDAEGNDETTVEGADEVQLV